MSFKPLLLMENFGRVRPINLPSHRKPTLFTSVREKNATLIGHQFHNSFLFLETGSENVSSSNDPLVPKYYHHINLVQTPSPLHPFSSHLISRSHSNSHSSHANHFHPLFPLSPPAHSHPSLSTPPIHPSATSKRYPLKPLPLFDLPTSYGTRLSFFLSDRPCSRQLAVHGVGLRGGISGFCMGWGVGGRVWGLR